MLQQLFFQFRVIFNDTIMYANDFRFYRAGTGSAAVAGDMGMGIDLTGFAMGCPTGMSNTTGSFQRISIVRFLDQIRKTALRLYYLCQASPSRTASPAESYPLYSNFDSPSRRIGAACLFPVNPTIPHIY